MKQQFVVTVEGEWLENDRPATAKDAEKMLRQAVREQFEFLAKIKVSKLAQPAKSK